MDTNNPNLEEEMQNIEGFSVDSLFDDGETPEEAEGFSVDDLFEEEQKTAPAPAEPVAQQPTPAEAPKQDQEQEAPVRQPDTFSDMGDEMIQAMAPRKSTQPAFEEPTFQPVSRDRMYYYGDEGKARLQRERELKREIQRMRALEASTSVMDRPDLSKLDQYTAELAQINAEKQEIYDAVQGDNVVDHGVFGKYITKEDGHKYYVPSPNQNDVQMIAFKAAMDTAEGLISSTPTGMLGLQKKVPRVRTDDPAVQMGAELTSLLIGGGLGLKGAGALKKMFNVTPESNRLARALLGPTVATSAGMAAVATEETATPIADMITDEEMGTLQKKLAVLGESIIFGGVIEGAGYTLKTLKNAPFIQAMSAGFTSLIKSKDKIAVENLAQVISDNVNKINNPQTQEELVEAYREVYDTLNTTFKDSTGMPFEEFLENSIQNTTPGYIPSLGEAVDDATISRLERAWRAEKSVTGRLFTESAEDRRLALLQQASNTIDELAPERATEEGMQALTQTLRPQLAEETSEVTRLSRDAQDELAVQTERAIAEEQQKAAVRVTEAEVNEQVAQQLQEQAQQRAEDALTGSAVSRSRLNDLRAVIADDTAAEQIAKTLSDDLTTKSRLGASKDLAYQEVQIPTDDAIDLADDVLTALADKDLLFVSAQDLPAVAPLLRRLTYSFRRFDDAPTTPRPTGAEPTTPVTSPDPSPAPPKTPTPGGEETLEELQKRLGTAKTPEEYLDIAKQISALIKKRRGRGQQASMSDEAPLDEMEYPELTAYDLENILLHVRDTSKSLKATSQGDSTRGNMQVAKLLDGAANVLQTKLDEIVEGSPAAVEARNEFATYFSGFKERWRSATGREYQADIIQASTQADIAEVAGQVTKLFANPNASESKIIAAESILNAMEPEAKKAFTKQMSDRILYETSNSLNIPAYLDGVNTISQVRQVLKFLDNGLKNTARYERMLPGAMDELRAVREELASVLDEAATAGAEAQARRETAKGIRTEAGQALESATRQLTEAQRASVRGVMDTLTSAVKRVENSALSKLVGSNDPIRYLSSTLDSPTGATQFRELWTRASMEGPQAQMQLRRGISRALLDRVYTPTKQEQASGAMSLDLLINITRRPNSVPSQIIRTAYADDPAGLEFMTMLAKSAASWKKSAFGARSAGDVSPAKVIEEGGKAMKDIMVMLYGPLTKKARTRTKMTDIAISMAGGEEKIARALVEHMTNPAKYKDVLKRAKELTRESMMPPVDAFRQTVLLSVIGSASMKDYFAFNDPIAELARDDTNYVLLQETEEALPFE